MNWSHGVRLVCVIWRCSNTKKNIVFSHFCECVFHLKAYTQLKRKSVREMCREIDRIDRPSRILCVGDEQLWITFSAESNEIQFGGNRRGKKKKQEKKSHSEASKKRRDRDERWKKNHQTFAVVHFNEHRIHWSHRICQWLHTQLSNWCAIIQNERKRFRRERERDKKLAATTTTTIKCYVRN